MDLVADDSARPDRGVKKDIHSEKLSEGYVALSTQSRDSDARVEILIIYIYTHRKTLKQASAPSVRAPTIWHLKTKERTKKMDFQTEFYSFVTPTTACFFSCSMALFVFQGLWPFLSVKLVV